MDNKKDNQLTSTHPSYGEVGFDINAHGPFGDNYACAHAYKKTEKLLIALHLVTNFVPEKEPARNAVRDKSVRILSDMLNLRSGFCSNGSERVDKVVASVYEVTSLLDILHAAGFVSDMNLEILKRELSGLIVFIREAENTEVSEKVVFGNDHFETGEYLRPSAGGNIKDSVKGNKMSFSIKDTTKTSPYNKKQNIKKTSSTSGSHTERRAAIVDLIKDKKSVNVKDVSAVITGCGEKTIQRELIALVQSGVLKKEGERRWSTYSLKQNSRL
ncbi:hypothetical protein ACFL6I_13145 [candidate division KSB1 bacterium]